MSDKFRLDSRIGFQNTFYTKYINVIIDSIGPSIILRSIYTKLKYVLTIAGYRNKIYLFLFLEFGLN